MFLLHWHQWHQQVFFPNKNIYFHRRQKTSSRSAICGFYMYDIWYTGWWLNQPIWKICSSKWKSSPNRDENKKSLKPPPRLYMYDIWYVLYVYVFASSSQAHINLLGTNIYIPLPFGTNLSWWCSFSQVGYGHRHGHQGFPAMCHEKRWTGAGGSVKALWTDGWMDGWMDGRMDGWQVEMMRDIYLSPSSSQKKFGT